jgi:hypothetical protein
VVEPSSIILITNYYSFIRSDSAINYFTNNIEGGRLFILDETFFAEASKHKLAIEEVVGREVILSGVVLFQRLVKKISTTYCVQTLYLEGMYSPAQIAFAKTFEHQEIIVFSTTLPYLLRKI